MYCDYHVHTAFSNDCNYPMEDVIKDAITKGIKEICITEHVDYLTNDLKYVVDYNAYIKEFNRLKDLYQDQIKMKLGVEFGMQTHTIHNFQKDFNQYPFDFVILSCHQIQDLEFWSQEFQKGKTQQLYNHDYYQEIDDVINQYHDYSVLGHLDMIKRYDLQGAMDDHQNEEIIKKILKKVIDDGKGIEINTSYIRYHLKDTTPSQQILKWYYELGGKILTFGSDSHEKDHLGFYIEQAKKEAKEIGFQYYCTFDQMKPIFHQL